jgi:hypothetical protein
MGRSQRHLREFQHYDSGGYDHWRNQRPTWAPVDSILHFDFERGRYWVAGVGTKIFSDLFFETPERFPELMWCIDTDVIAAVRPPMTVVHEYYAPLVEDNETVLWWLHGTDTLGDGFTYYQWGGEHNLYNGNSTPEFDLYNGTVLLGRNKVAISADKASGANAKFSYSGNGAAVTSETVTLTLPIPATIAVRRFHGHVLAHPIVLTAYELRPDADLPGLSAL